MSVFLGLFSALEGEHLSRLISEKGRVEASEIGVVDLGLSETFKSLKYAKRLLDRKNRTKKRHNFIILLRYC